MSSESASTATLQLPIILDGHKYFRVVKQEGVKITAECITCLGDGVKHGATFNGSLNATSNFVTHLKRRHKPAYDEYTLSVKNSKRRRVHQTNQPTLTSFAKPIEGKQPSRIERLVANFIVKGMHPLSIVTQPEFVQLVNGLDKNAHFSMSTSTLQRRISLLNEEMKRSIIKNLSQASFLCITLDIWSCRGNRRSFLGVTIHWISDDLERKSHAIACRRFKGEHNYSRIAELSASILSEYGVAMKKVIKAVTDNATNFVKCFKHLSDQQETVEAQFEDDNVANLVELDQVDLIEIEQLGEGGEDYNYEVSFPIHHRCSSHTLSLVCTTDIKTNRTNARRAFGKCQGIWNKIGRSVKSSEKVQEILGSSIPKPCATRWNSMYDCLRALLKKQELIPEICASLSTAELTDADILFLNEYCQCVQPIAVALDRLQGENSTYYGELLPTLLTVQKKLGKLQDEGGLDTCSWLPDLVLTSFNKRFKGFLEFSPDHNDAILAAISHPYFKLRWIPEAKLVTFRNMFLDKVCLEMSREQIAAEVLPTENIESSQKLQDDFFEFEDTNLTERAMHHTESKIRHECAQYFEEKSQLITSLFKYPSIKFMFIKYNTALPSSAAVERLFNYSNMVLDPFRQRLTDQNFEMLTLLKVNDFTS